MMKNRVAIMGSPNVGKSSLFNRFIGKRTSLVHNQPGVTRDRLIQQTIWYIATKPYCVEIVDTGGVNLFENATKKDDFLMREIFTQFKRALEQSNVLCFVMDAQTGLTDSDIFLFRFCMKNGLFQNKTVLGIVNKIDLPQHESLMPEFYALEFTEIFALSAEHNRGVETIKEAIVATGFESMPDTDQIGEQKKRIAIVGRPNVGKSSIINAFMDTPRVVVSPIAGTTLDSVDVPITLKKQSFIFTDTAGVRRKSKTVESKEVLSIVQTKKALKNADIALLVLDAQQGFVNQDEKVASLILEARCGVIILINKWDIAHMNRSQALAELSYKMAFLSYAPVLFVSATQNKGLDGLLEAITDVLKGLQTKLSTHAFTEWVREESKINNPFNAKFFLCHQTSQNPPAFVLHVNDPEKVHFSLKRYLVNAMRKHFGFVGVPMDLQLKKANRRSLPKKIEKPMVRKEKLPCK